MPTIGDKGTTVILRTKDKRGVIRRRWWRGDEEAINRLVSEFKQEMEGWYRSDQFVGRALEIVQFEDRF